MGRVQPLDGHHKYEKISDLGEGAFGFVQLARNKHTGEHVAIKFLPRGPDVSILLRRSKSPALLSMSRLFTPSPPPLVGTASCTCIACLHGADTNVSVQSTGLLSSRAAFSIYRLGIMLWSIPCNTHTQWAACSASIHQIGASQT